MTVLRTTVTPDLYAAADAATKAAGTTIAAVMRAAIEAYVVDAAQAPEPDVTTDLYVPTRAEHRALKAWSAANPETFAAYLGAVPINSHDRLAEFYAWALTQGFDPA